MAKRMMLLLCAALAVNCLTGCSQEQVEETVPAGAEPQIVSVVEHTTVDGMELVIDAQVEVPDLRAMEEIQLTFDEALLDKMVEELVHSQYPGLEEGTMDGYRSWSVSTPETLQFSFDCDDNSFEAGWTGYLDVQQNLNGQDMGDDEMMRWTPCYMTPHIPDKLNMTSEEAAEEMADFLEQYSCFDYTPRNVVAVNCSQIPGFPGYYQAMMQPQYDGWPVYIDGTPYVSMCLSAEGVFTFQGVMILKEKERSSVEAAMTLEEAVERFKADCPMLINNDRVTKVTIEKISAGYVAVCHYDGTWVLSPIWLFEYGRTEPHLNTGEEVTYYSTCIYRMEDGSYFDVN